MEGNVTVQILLSRFKTQTALRVHLWRAVSYLAGTFSSEFSRLPISFKVPPGFASIRNCENTTEYQARCWQVQIPLSLSTKLNAPENCGFDPIAAHQRVRVSDRSAPQR